MRNRKLAIVVTVACAVTPFSAVASKADAPPLGSLPTSPDYLYVVQPADMSGAIPKRVGISDLACYSSKNLRSFRQVRDSAGYAFVTKSGRSVAGWDRQTRTFYSFTKDRIICAAWRG